MFTYDIVKLAAKQGWSVTVNRSKSGYSFDFRRRTLGGFPFCFTAELTENRPGTLVDEILSFVDELDPVRVAGEWLEASGQFSPTRFCQAVADMDEIRTQAFLLAIELAEAVENDNIFFQYSLVFLELKSAEVPDFCYTVQVFPCKPPATAFLDGFWEIRIV